MIAAVDATPLNSGRQRRRLHWQPAAVVGLTVFGLVVVATAFAPLLTPYGANEQVLRDSLQPPSTAHPLGTDRLGRDVLARILYGGRFSLLITMVAVLVSGTLGTLLGATAGRLGGAVDEVVTRLIDLFLAVPGILVAIVITALLKPGFGTLVLAITVTGWPTFARLARAVALEINTRTYIEAAVALGTPEFLILRTHVLRNILAVTVALGFLRFGHVLLMIAGLSYLGLGAQPPTPDWGAMLADAQPYMQRVPMLVLAPGLTIFATTLSVTLAGQGLTLMFDPQRTWARAR